MPGPDAVDLYLTVDPAANTVQPSYAVTTNGVAGPRKALGGPVSMPAALVRRHDAASRWASSRPRQDPGRSSRPPGTS